MTLQEIENKLLVGQVSPPELAEMKTWIGAESSRIMDAQSELTLLHSDFYIKNKHDQKSDKFVHMMWLQTEMGKKQNELEVYQRKLKSVKEGISSQLRIAELVARNLV